MEAELKAKWIAALRSGDYQQGRGRLRDGDKFCCMGVLCDIIEPVWKDDDYLDTYQRDGYRYFMPRDLEVLIGGRINAVTLGDMNDGHSTPAHSFHEIAQWIEDNI